VLCFDDSPPSVWSASQTSASTTTAARTTTKTTTPLRERLSWTRTAKSRLRTEEEARVALERVWADAPELKNVLWIEPVELGQESWN
jgi:hypothetical protein